MSHFIIVSRPTLSRFALLFASASICGPVLASAEEASSAEIYLRMNACLLASSQAYMEVDAQDPATASLLATHLCSDRINSFVEDVLSSRGVSLAIEAGETSDDAARMEIIEKHVVPAQVEILSRLRGPEK